MSFFTGFVTGAANEAVDIQKENKSRRQELVDKAMDRFYEFTLPEQRKYAQTQQKLGQTMGALRSAGYSDAEARTLINSFGADKSAAEILQFAKPPKARTTATEPAAEVDQTTAALGQAPTAETGTEMPTAGVMPEEAAPTGTQTASTMPQEGFDLGRVLFDQNSPERTTGAILAALSAETGLKPEQIDAYLRGEFGPDLTQGETAPVEISPVSRATEWEEEQARERLALEQENRLSLEEFKQKHDFALAEKQTRDAIRIAEREAELKATEVGVDPTDARTFAKDAAGSALAYYGEFAEDANGNAVFTPFDPTFNEFAQLHGAIASNEIVHRLGADKGRTSATTTPQQAARDTRPAIETIQNAASFVAEDNSASPDHYTKRLADVVRPVQSPDAKVEIIKRAYAAWKNAAVSNPEVLEAIAKSEAAVLDMMQR